MSLKFIFISSTKQIFQEPCVCVKLRFNFTFFENSILKRYLTNGLSRVISAYFNSSKYELKITVITIPCCNS